MSSLVTTGQTMAAITKPTPYFAYADTIQEQALYLVAAKVAAALRVNGDTIADDSGQGTGLAELDGITGNDIVATLARIVTGDTEVSTQSLQQAFAEANASLRQANTLIGEYSIADDDEDVESQSALETIGQRPLPISGNGQPVNGPTRQPSLFSGNQAKPNGTATTVPLNGNGMLGDNGTPTQQEEVMPPGDSRPSVPRPRLLIGQLGAK